MIQGLGEIGGKSRINYFLKRKGWASAVELALHSQGLRTVSRGLWLFHRMGHSLLTRVFTQPLVPWGSGSAHRFSRLLWKWRGGERDGEEGWGEVKSRCAGQGSRAGEEEGEWHSVSAGGRRRNPRAGHTWPIRCLSNLYSLGNWLLIYLPILSPRGGQKVTKQSPQSLIQKDRCFSSYSEKLKTLLGHFRNFKIEISMHPVRHLSCSQ